MRNKKFTILFSIYVEAIANNTAKTVTFIPKGAEHDVYFFRVSSTNSNTESEMVIN